MGKANLLKPCCNCHVINPGSWYTIFHPFRRVFDEVTSRPLKPTDTECHYGIWEQPSDCSQASCIASWTYCTEIKSRAYTAPSVLAGPFGSCIRDRAFREQVISIVSLIFRRRTPHLPQSLPSLNVVINRSSHSARGKMTVIIRLTPSRFTITNP